jgi:hypothetical protein
LLKKGLAVTFSEDASEEHRELSALNLRRILVSLLKRR